MASKIFGLLCVLLGLKCIFTSPIVYENGGYNGIVVSIAEDVPRENCRHLLNNLQSAFTSGSQKLFDALEHRAYINEISINLPDHWPDSCATQPISSSMGDPHDVIIGRSHPVHGDDIWTQQSKGCGQNGDFIYISENMLMDMTDLGSKLATEWSKYRYGVFDEVGYANDAVYPQCYHGLGDKAQVTGCSDKPIDNVCATGDLLGDYNTTKLVHSDAKRSLLFSNADNVVKFCDEHTHDKFAPNKQNVLCDRKSAMEIILQHEDFANKHFDYLTTMNTNTTPTFTYTRRRLTRYVLVLEDTKDMLIRESWSFLRSAIRKWTVHDLPSNTEVGLVLANESSAIPISKLTPLNGPSARDFVPANVPYSPGDSRSPACVTCGVREALQMLLDRRLTHGPANSIILVVAPGLDRLSDIDDVIDKAVTAHIKVASVNYPGILRSHSLDVLSSATGGPSFTVAEVKHNLIQSLVSTYFQLSNVLFSITTQFFEGNPYRLPIEIHRRELTDDGRSQVTGSFVLEESLGEPAKFVIYTHSTENPLLKGIQLVSPSQKVYSIKSDTLVPFKLLTVITNINETGTWTYTIERFAGNPQPHYVQVMASPRSPTAPVVQAKLWTNQNNRNYQFHQRQRRELPGQWTEAENEEFTTNTQSLHDNIKGGRSISSNPSEQDSNVKTTRSYTELVGNGSYDSKSSDNYKSGLTYKVTADDLKRTAPNVSTYVKKPVQPVALYVEVKRGDWPVMGARVEVTVSKRSDNETNRYRERFELLDSGSGDPDLMRGDGIYSRYWSPIAGGKGSYVVDVLVTDNGNTAYSWNDGFLIPQNAEECCGSFMKTPSVRPLSPFQRQLPPLTLTFSQEDIDDISTASVGRVADLKVEYVPSELKARLTWTAPDMGGLNVARYSLHFSPSLETLLANPLATPTWSHGTPFPLASGSETSFTLDFSQDRNLLDQSLYFAMFSFSSNYHNSVPGPISNFVRVLMPSPPPPPPPVPTEYTNWFNRRPEVEDGANVPKIAQAEFGLEIILSIAGGILFLIVCVTVYCYFCLVRKKHAGVNKAKQSPKSSPEKSKQSTINIISPPTMNDNRTHSTSSTTSSNTSHSTLQQDNNMQYPDCYQPEPTVDATLGYGYTQEPRYEAQCYDDQRRRYGPVQNSEEAYIIAQARSMSNPRPPSNLGYLPPHGYTSSQISTGTTGRIRTLSPYQSWTASQLLHEHERRTSPYEEKPDINHHNGPQFQLPPPVPPLPAGAYPEEDMYHDSGLPPHHYTRNNQSFVNTSLQGSMNSVNSSDVRKKRNVTMV